MSEKVPSETLSLNDHEIAGIAIAMEGVHKQRLELIAQDPQEMVKGVTENRELLVIDELHESESIDAHFIVRYASISKLIEDEPLEEQSMSYREVRRFRDGGTTIMPTKFGVVVSPAPNRKLPSRLDKKIIMPLSILGKTDDTKSTTRNQQTSSYNTYSW